MIINPYRFSAAAADVPRDGLIAEYLFDTDASDTAGEASGPYDGTATGATIGSGVATFDGNDDYITIADNDIFSFNDIGGGTDRPFSISMWVKPTTAVGSEQELAFKFSASGNREWAFQIVSDGKFGFGCYTSTAAHFIYVKGSTVYTQSNWVHVVGTYDGSEVKENMILYVDGVDDTGSYLGNSSNYQPNGAMSNTAADVILGAYYSGSSYVAEFTGDMDNVRIYDRELTQTDIDDLFAEGHS